MERNLSKIFLSESLLSEILTLFLPTMISEIYFMYFYTKRKFIIYHKEGRVFLLKLSLKKQMIQQFT